MCPDTVPVGRFNRRASLDAGNRERHPLARHEPAFAKDDGAFAPVPELAQVAGRAVPI